MTFKGWDLGALILWEVPYTHTHTRALFDLQQPNFAQWPNYVMGSLLPGP